MAWQAKTMKVAHDELLQRWKSTSPSLYIYTYKVEPIFLGAPPPCPPHLVSDFRACLACQHIFLGVSVFPPVIILGAKKACLDP